jgi:hypothetical protein
MPMGMRVNEPTRMGVDLSRAALARDRCSSLAMARLDGPKITQTAKLSAKAMVLSTRILVGARRETVSRRSFLLLLLDGRGRRCAVEKDVRSAGRSIYVGTRDKEFPEIPTVTGHRRRPSAHAGHDPSCRE